MRFTSFRIVAPCRIIFGALLTALILTSGSLFAQDAPPPAADNQPPKREGFTLVGKQEYDIQEFMMYVATIQGYKFMLTPNQALNQKVTIVASVQRPGQKADEAGLFIPYKAMFAVLQAMLKAHKMILAPFGEDTDNSVQFYEVMPLAEAISAARAEDVIELSDVGEFKDTGAGFVTLIAETTYVDANILRSGLQNFVGRAGAQVIPIPSNSGKNYVMIADYAHSVRRLAKMIKLMDQPPRAPRMEVIHIANMDAEELAVALDDLIARRRNVQQAAGPGGQPTAVSGSDAVDITVAPNVNALIVQGFDNGIALVQSLVKQLDVKIPGQGDTTGRLHHYQARNVRAEDLAATLNDLLGQGVPLGQQQGPGVPPPAVPAGQQPGVAPEDVPIIVENRETNSLLIIAKPSDYNEIQKILQVIDVRRPQVMIEAAILEVREEEDFTFGVELAALDGAGKGLRVNAGTSFGFSEIVDAAGVPIGTGGGEPSGRLPIFGSGGIFTLTNGGAFRIPLLVRLLKQQTDINILSVPMIVSKDNPDATEQAEIEITTSVPISTTSTLTANNIQQGFGGFEEDGITLRVTPSIQQGGYVDLVIDLDVSAFIGQPATPGQPPPRTNRRLRTRVTVPNGQTVVIGGLTSNQASKSEVKIPFFGDIPLLGQLFKSETATGRRANLYIFVRPEIFSDRDFDDIRKESARQLTSAHDKLIPSKTSEEWYGRAIRDNEKTTVIKPGSAPRRLGLGDLPADDK